jgi:hypothetical protein
MKNPVTLAADRAQNRFNVLPTLNSFEITTPPAKIQEQRAAFIARKCRISRDIAETIALLAFGEMAQ